MSIAPDDLAIMDLRLGALDNRLHSQDEVADVMQISRRRVEEAEQKVVAELSAMRPKRVAILADLGRSGRRCLQLQSVISEYRFVTINCVASLPSADLEEDRLAALVRGCDAILALLDDTPEVTWVNAMMKEGALADKPIIGVRIRPWTRIPTSMRAVNAVIVEAFDTLKIKSAIDEGLKRLPNKAVAGVGRYLNQIIQDVKTVADFLGELESRVRAKAA